MGWYVEGAETLARKRIESRLRNPFALMHPVLYFLGLRDKESMKKLSRPTTGVYLGGMADDAGSAKTQKMTSDIWLEFPYLKVMPSQSKRLSSKDDTLPAATTAMDDLYGHTAFGWSLFSTAAKARQKAIDETKSELGLRALVEDAADVAFEEHMTLVNTSVRAGTLTLAQQNVSDGNYWADLLGINHVMTASNAYGLVDRSVETSLNPLAINAATDLDSTVVDLNLSRIVSVGNSTVSGLGFRAERFGGKGKRGKMLALCTTSLWQELANQADGTYQIYHDGMPDMAVSGWQYPIIATGECYYIAVEDQPSGTIDFLNLPSWHFMMAREYSFTFQGWVPKHKTEEASAMYQWNNLLTKLRLVCSEPWLNARVSNLTTG